MFAIHLKINQCYHDAFTKRRKRKVAAYVARSRGRLFPDSLGFEPAKREANEPDYFLGFCNALTAMTFARSDKKVSANDFSKN